MKFEKTLVTLLASMSLAISVASSARAEIGYATPNNKRYVTASGQVAFLPTTGEFRSTPGGSQVPVCSGSLGMLYFHQTASGTTNSDAVKDRLISLLTAAMLAGKNVNINFTRNASNQCFIDNIFFNTTF